MSVTERIKELLNKKAEERIKTNKQYNLLRYLESINVDTNSEDFREGMKV